jgi:predicted amidohydrolase
MEDGCLAAAQVVCRLGDFEGNLIIHRDYAARAAEAGAAFVCFPELSLCGYPAEGDIPHDLAQPLDGELAQAIAEIADEFRLVVLAGMLERASSGVLYNTQLIAAPDNRLEAYRKTHVPTSEIGRFGLARSLLFFPSNGP